ncbi:short-chain dehydrogenase/reductase [Enterococcus plantarum]|uniref:Short-chain dehydrogenase/reductase n=1 Tax=Enterococcus plantarum TaxID=1077675 RepID=A0A2W4BTS3_9ENTE|nr:SDR family oxidoreductase [Enterococcus plantarum]PZL76649.1 short-chain dehydrogenase/reductase [Enterococcus plantarum]
MKKQTWLITGVSSGFGLELTKQLLANGQTVIGTVRKDTTVQDLMAQYPETFDREFLDVTDATGIKTLVDKVYQKYGTIDVLVNNAGYGLFGAAEELTDQDVAKIIATNLTGSIQMIRAVTPFMREQQAGRIIQLSSYGGQVAFAGNSMYHATKWGIEGFCESVAQELAPFNIGVTIVEPGGARTEFRYGSAQVAELMPEYDNNPAHAFLAMLDPANELAAGDPERMATRILESAAIEPAPLRMVLGSQTLDSTIQTLEKRVADFKKQTELAASTDF